MRNARTAGMAALAAPAAGAVYVYVKRRRERAQNAPPRSRPGPRTGLHAVTIHKPVDEVYAYWRDLTKLPTFLNWVQHVEVTDDRRSRWTLQTPDGETLWGGELTADVPGSRLAWRITNGPAQNTGEVSFTAAPGEWGTEVRTRMTGRSGTEISAALRRLKAVIETGEVLSVEGQPAGDRGQLTVGAA